MRSRSEAFMNDLQMKDIKVLEKWFNEESIVWIPPAHPLKGKDRIPVLFRAIFARYNDLNWKVKAVHRLRERHYVYFSETWGQLKTGIPYQNHMITDILFNESGEIADLSDYFKDTSLFKKA